MDLKTIPKFKKNNVMCFKDLFCITEELKMKPDFKL